MNHIPETKIKPKHWNAIDDIASQMVGYQAVLQGAGDYLDSRKRLPQQLAFKLQTEITLLGKLLQGMFGMPVEIWRAKVTEAESDPGFQDEVKKLADQLSPEPNVLLSPDQCKQEIMTMKRKGKWGWSL